MAKVKHIGNIGAGDANADWIKRLRGGESQRNELRLHARLAVESAKRTGNILAQRMAEHELASLGETEA